MIPRERVEQAARSIAEGIMRDDSLFDLAQGALHAGGHDTDVEALVSRLRAALRLIENEEITPVGRRIIEKILDQAP